MAYKYVIIKYRQRFVVRRVETNNPFGQQPIISITDLKSFKIENEAIKYKKKLEGEEVENY